MHASTTVPSTRAGRPPRARRGSALLLVLLLTLALGGLAVSAIYLSSNGTMLTKLHDRERDFRYSAEWALAVGKARLAKDTALVLPDSLYTQLLSNANVVGANGTAIPRVTVDLYAGLSGAVNGQFGKAVSLVAVAKDASGARHVRRLELAAENFARFAVFTDQWSGGACYTTGEIVRGRAHSNASWQSCSSSPGPIYTDSVSAVGSVTGTAQYQSATVNGAARIPYPTVAKLAKLPTIAAAAGLSFTPVAATAGGTRMQFVTFDLNGDGVIGSDEGFFMVFDGDIANDTNVTRAGFANGTAIMSLTGSDKTVEQTQCGAFYTLGGRAQFVPVKSHNTAWFFNLLVANGWTNATATTLRNAADTTILKQPGARCYPAGDPHLVSTERTGALGQKGGEDSTYTVTTTTGHWRTFPGGTPAAVTAAVAAGRVPAPIGAYLWPLHRALNAASQGVIYVNGSIYVSGTVRGRVTLYAAQDVKFIDDLTYTTNPAALPICQNLLGIIAGYDAWLADNAINRPRLVKAGNPGIFLDDNQDFFLHGVVLAGVNKTDGSFRTEDYNLGPNASRLCTATTVTVQTSGGCINQAGGVIEKTVQPTFASGWTGFAENRVKDACLDIDSPPYFPLTGRFLDNEFYELDPAQFNVLTLYRSLQGATP